MTRPECAEFRDAQFNRRDLLRVGGLSLFGTTLPGLLAGRTHGAPAPGLSLDTFGKAKSCILLFMWGGPSQLDTWDLKPHAPEGVRGEFRPIATRTPGVSISEHLPLLAQRTDRLAIIRSMTHKDVNHFEASHEMLTGQIPLPSRNVHDDWPNIGAVLAKIGRGRDPLPPYINIQPELPNDVPNNASVTRGQMAGWLGPTFDPLVIKPTFPIWVEPGTAPSSDWCPS